MTTLTSFVMLGTWFRGRNHSIACRVGAFLEQRSLVSIVEQGNIVCVNVYIFFFFVSDIIATVHVILFGCRTGETCAKSIAYGIFISEERHPRAVPNVRSRVTGLSFDNLICELNSASNASISIINL